MSTERLRRLIEKWRGFASEPIQLPPETTAEAALTWFNGRNRAYAACADELEALLAAGSPTLVEQVMKLQTYAYAWQGTEFGGLVERDKVLAILSAASEPARKDP
jgi:hypothetical protein